ncbi:MAG: ABC transporter ATP-binding protein [Euryarchaeota archaeon]|nr:ABC transporter ATP-binding protein [Euryarchaeota archaeon]MBU4071857.1 ABC transporter ATP-binding protein [Candidatus Thermoplasmatota archaeon]
MEAPIIEVKNLSKLYLLGKTQYNQRLTESITNTIMHPIQAIKGATAKKEEFWALKDISFKVEKGEIVGIIGRNGAGKSTLLKVLSQITFPTEGEVVLRGRVGSLLEVGTGFHPELTGRENIYLNGRILGMKKKEIEDKFKDIVKFAEIDKFLDTPVKRYSSGMYVRLAFAVAAHLDPEILIVDEVLAVGDAQFQKKCLGKMKDVSQEGRTVLFVSHNMAAVSTLCNKGILLDAGKIISEGFVDDIINSYIEKGKETLGERVWKDFNTAPGDDVVRLKSVQIISDGEVTDNVRIDKDVLVEFEFWNKKPGALISSSIHLLDRMGVGVLASSNMRSASLNDDGWFGRQHPVGLFKTSCKIPANFLNEGQYFINVIILTDVMNARLKVDEVVSFTVHDTGEMRKEYAGNWLGVVRPKLEWRTNLMTESEVIQ